MPIILIKNASNQIAPYGPEVFGLSLASQACQTQAHPFSQFDQSITCITILKFKNYVLDQFLFVIELLSLNSSLAKTSNGLKFYILV